MLEGVRVLRSECCKERVLQREHILRRKCFLGEGVLRNEWFKACVFEGVNVLRNACLQK